MRRRGLPAALLVVGLLAVPGPATRAQAAPAPGIAARAPVTVTLITGDRVTTAADGSTSIERAPGRSGVRFVGRTDGGHRYVIPADALPLLRDGRLDQRLFDLTTLRASGYTGDTELPLLVSYPRGGRSKGSASVRAATGATARVVRDLPEVGLLAVRAARTARAGLWTSLTRGTVTARTLRPGIERLYLDGRRRLDLDVSVPQIGAPVAWRQGLDGTGVTVAVLDSGIDATHPDFAGKLAAVENFSADASADDVVGHGTHVASTIAGSGAKSGGRNRGVAPGAMLAIGKVCEPDACLESNVLAGMQWAARTAPVVSMSLGGRDTLGIDPLEQAVDDLTAAHGTLFVVSAGNDGGAGTIGPLGSAQSALTVGAVDDEDRLAGFSSRGPRAGDDAIKPDITAPGVGIVAAGAANGSSGTPAGDGYVSLNGTSMAAPHVAGAAAIVTQQHPGWSPKQRKALLMGAAEPTAGVDVFGQGAGRVDVARAVGQAVLAEEGSVSFGRQEWPHHDDTPVTRTVTYRNAGDAPIALSLSVAGDTGTFSLGATGLTVPAGATATTTVTADTGGGEGADGFRTGRIVATGPGGVKVETPVAVNREVESYDVTVRHIGRDGRPSADYWTSLNGLDEHRVVNLAGPDPDRTVRLPKGAYGIYGWVYGETGMTMLVQPELVVDGPETVTLDARRGRPVDITVPRADARQSLLAVSVDWLGGTVPIGALTLVEDAGDLFTARVGPHAEVAGFATSISASFARWADDDRGFFGSPYSYDAAFLREGTFITGFTRRLADGRLATVRATYAREADDAHGVKTNVADLRNGTTGWTVGYDFPLPFERTEHLSTEGGAVWWGRFEQATPGVPEPLSLAIGPRERLAAGAAHRQDWNRAVVAPTVSGGRDHAVRYDDLIVAQVPLFTQGAGHWGRSATDAARTALYAGDDLIGEVASDFGEFAVPPQRQTYRLEISASRSAPFRLSTSVRGVWTFASGNGDTRLPLSTVRFSPRVDEHNVAPPGAFTVPVAVERAADSPAEPTAKLTAEFSVDDGRTWRPATVHGTGDERTLRVTNPPAGFVSLRANTTDAAGNTAAITVLRAYQTG
jgi:subtilisin family serine protease